MKLVVELSDVELEILKMTVGCASVECLISTKEEASLIKKLEGAVTPKAYRKGRGK